MSRGRRRTAPFAMSVASQLPRLNVNIGFTRRRLSRGRGQYAGMSLGKNTKPDTRTETPKATKIER